MGWNKARSAAWTTFGNRWWKWIVAFEMAWKLAPTILIVVVIGAIAALLDHMPAILSDIGVDWMPWVVGGILAALAVVLVAAWWWNPPTSYHPKSRRGKVAVAVMVAIAVVALLAR